ncbi:MAG: class I SAM-dependent methyltransferase [Candidatus Bathyarchaeia archaeon]|nr:class I SAM-dependent methyltransferase [Candidatus Bathyarchaeia archaeon]
MSDWIKKLFVERSDLFLKLMNERWPRTEELVNGMVKVLNDYGVTSGNLLDLCCGNGRISVYMAKKGFKTVGVDISKAFIEDAGNKAREHGVSSSVTFLEGDVRKLKEVIGDVSEPFDVVVNAWTSIGYFSQEDDLNIFKQARELSREGAILFIAETTHSDFIFLKFTPTAYTEVDNIVMLENRKYDPTTSRIASSWAFYNKRGEDLKFIDRVEIEHHIYSLSELSSLLRKAGWETVACYGSLLTLQPMNPLTSLNIVARAR